MYYPCYKLDYPALNSGYCLERDTPYSLEENQTWATLYANQINLLPNRVCEEFLDGVQYLNLPSDRIPSLKEVSDHLQAISGWRLSWAEGVVPDDEFFELLANRFFPSTDFIRKPEDIGYTPAPDMFHDIFGHTPLLTNPRFCSFFEQFGKAGLKAFMENHPAKEWLPRIYWYAVEFGLIQGKDGLRIYGSGIVSSASEVVYSLSDKTRKRPFDLEVIAQEPYDIWHMQEQLFVIESFDQLEESFAEWTKKHGLYFD